MFEELSYIFSYEFMKFAFITGVLTSLCASLLGVNLVLKRYSMIGDGLAHVGFGAFALIAVVNIFPTWAAIPVVGLAAVLLLRVSANSKIKGDALIAITSSGVLALGIILLTVFNVRNEINRYMLGSIYALDKYDVIVSVACSVVIIVFYAFFYNKIYLVTFDEEFAKTQGINVSLFNTSLAVLTAVIIVIGMRFMGALLISGLIIFPSLSAMRIFKNFKSVIICSAITSVICFTIGYLVAFYFSLPPGASIVAVNFILFLFYSVVGKIIGKYL